MIQKMNEFTRIIQQLTEFQCDQFLPEALQQRGAHIDVQDCKGLALAEVSVPNTRDQLTIRKRCKWFKTNKLLQQQVTTTTTTQKIQQQN
jgi:hypothetical protein